MDGDNDANETIQLSGINNGDIEVEGTTEIVDSTNTGTIGSNSINVGESDSTRNQENDKLINSNYDSSFFIR